MYCGNCFRDNALVAALRRLGHSTLMVPLYLPMTLDEADQSAGTPIFFGGVSVYLEQKSPLFRRAPRWVRRVLASPTVLKWAAGKAAKTRAADVGDITLSMLRGEEGNQARELDELIAWLRGNQPDVVCLSNALLAGMARRIQSELHVPVVGMFQGEDSFLDTLPEPLRAAAWRTLAERAAGVDAFIAPSRYFAARMRERLHLPAGRVRVVFNGINLEGFGEDGQSPKFDGRGEYSPVIGFFARMCREKGLDTLVEAFLLLKERPATKRARLHIGGGCGPGDESFVNDLRLRLEEQEALGDVEFFPNVDRAGKLEFFRSLSVFSVPALYGEAFGLYVIEALAAGVPVVQPRVASFPELVEATGGGVLCEPGDAKALADALESLLLHPLHARHLGQRGQQAVREKFGVDQMAREVARVCEETVRERKRG